MVARKHFNFSILNISEFLNAIALFFSLSVSNIICAFCTFDWRIVMYMRNDEIVLETCGEMVEKMGCHSMRSTSTLLFRQDTYPYVG